MMSESTRTLLAQSPSFRSLFYVLVNKHILEGFLLYGLGAILWLGVLSKWEVSKAYPLVGLGFVFTAILGYLLGEQVTIYRVIGVMLICFGVFLIART